MPFRLFDRRLVVACFVSAAASSLAPGASAQEKEAPRPPVVVTKVDALYPPAALAKGQRADVVLAVTVGVDGRVSDVEVASSGGDEFDRAATTAVRQWSFTPAMRGLTALASKIRVPFHFAPPDEGAPEVVGAPNPSAAPSASPAARPASGPAPATPVPSASGPGPVPNAVAAGGGPALPATPAAGQGGGRAKQDDGDEVVVVGRSAPPTRGASDFRIEVGELGRVPRGNASEMLKLAPGILLTNEGGEGHAEQVFLRGFDAREGQDIEFTVGGVPINESGNLHGNGYADTHFILPELVRGLRVLEGPYDPRQGNYAVAGSADYELGLDRRGLTAKYTAGSWGTQRAVLLWGPRAQSTGTFGGAEIYKTSGYGQNRDATRGSAMAQYEGKVGAEGSFRVTSQAYSTTYHSAGVLRDDDYRAGRVGFYGTYDPNQGGDSSRYSVAGDVEAHDGTTVYRAQAFVITRTMRLRENFTGFLLDTQDVLQNPHGQRGDLLDLYVSEKTLGSRGSAKYRTTLFGHTQEVEFGYFARGDGVGGTQYRVEASTNAPYHKDTDIDATLGDIGLYADANLRPAPMITVRGGVRADAFTYDVNNNCAVQTVAHPSASNPPGDQSCLSQENLGAYREPVQRSTASGAALMPRASLLLGPWRDFTASLSYGQGVRSVDPIYVTQDAQAPFASVKSYDGGVSYAGTLGTTLLVARSIFFQTHVDHDLVFSESAGRNVLANGTTRTGWVGAVRATNSWVDESANLTFVRSSFDDTHLLVPYVPDTVFRSDTAVHHRLPWQALETPLTGAAGVGVSYIGRRALPYGERSDTIFTMDASASVSWKAYELTLVSTNLLDTRYRLGEYNYASDFHSQPGATLVPVRHFTAGPPRGVFASFAVTLGGEG